jgi:hypothetical protein
MERLGDRMWEGLLALLAASLDQALELPACVLLGSLIMRRQRNVPIELVDAGMLALLLVLTGLLARRILRGPERPISGFGIWHKTPKGAVAPTASWAHVVWAALSFTLAYGLWTIDDAGTGQRSLGFGLGFVVVPASFLVLRGLVRLQRSS